MRRIPIAGTDLALPAIGVGCMRMEALPADDAERFVRTALDHGMNFFDHADIYGGGRSEEVFREAMRRGRVGRDRIILQSKCGIRRGCWDFSKKHILESVDGILSRLGTDRLDLLLLHRPDALMEGEEVAAAFDELSAAGKVGWFGVSNHNAAQMELLGAYVERGLVVNQLQFSVVNCGLVRSGMNVNMENEAGIDRDGSLLDYCRARSVSVQAWSPLQYGFFGGTFIDSPKFPELNAALLRIAEARGVTKAAVAIAWILRHPAKILPIVGTMNAERLIALSEAARVALTREEWYELLVSAGNSLP